MTHHDTAAQEPGHTATPTAAKPSDTPIFPIDFRHAVNNIDEEDRDEINEYVVDVDIHQSFFVRATTPETAIAKAVLHTIDPEEDGTVTEVSRDVHTCVHTGIDDCEEHEEHEEHEGAE